MNNPESEYSLTLPNYSHIDKGPNFTINTSLLSGVYKIDYFSGDKSFKQIVGSFIKFVEFAGKLKHLYSKSHQDFPNVTKLKASYRSGEDSNFIEMPLLENNFREALNQLHLENAMWLTVENKFGILTVGPNPWQDLQRSHPAYLVSVKSWIHEPLVHIHGLIKETSDRRTADQIETRLRKTLKTITTK